MYQSDNNEWEKLIDKRLVICDGDYESVTSVMKSVLGGDKIVYRPLYGQPTTFIPNLDIIMCVNQDRDVSLNRRVRVISFDNEFVDNLDPNQIEVFRHELLNRTV